MTTRIMTAKSRSREGGTAGYTYYALDIWVVRPRGVSLPVLQ